METEVLFIKVVLQMVTSSMMFVVTVMIIMKTDTSMTIPNQKTSLPKLCSKEGMKMDIQLLTYLASQLARLITMSAMVNKTQSQLCIYLHTILQGQNLYQIQTHYLSIIKRL